jgi:hypothetical protein
LTAQKVQMCNWKPKKSSKTKRPGRTRRRQNREARVVVVVSPKGKIIRMLGTKVLSTQSTLAEHHPVDGVLTARQLRSVGRGLLHIHQCGGHCEMPICISTKRLLRRITRHRRRQEVDGHNPRTCRACSIWTQIQSAATHLARASSKKTRTKRR